MSRWYWGAIACAAAFVLSWFILPPYVRKDGLGAVYTSEIGLSWNWTDSHGNPLHDGVGNPIKPFWPRMVVLIVFAVGAAGLFAAGLAFPRRARICDPPLNGNKGD